MFRTRPRSKVSSRSGTDASSVIGAARPRFRRSS